jgi:hypothetical protein
MTRRSIGLTLLLGATCAMAQPSWQPQTPVTTPPIEIFASIMMPNLPTAETLSEGDFHYEISHRFEPPVEEGLEALYGLDGPVSMRMSVSYGLTDAAYITLGRSSRQDNLDLHVTRRLAGRTWAGHPVALAARAGIAWNSEVPALVDRGAADLDNVQYFVQFIGTTALLDGAVRIGLVPSYLHNSAIFAVETQSTVAVGGYALYELGGGIGLWAEHNVVVSGYRGIQLPGETGRSYASLSTGASLETGGHMFYLFVTNNTRLNSSQYLVGSPQKLRAGDLRLAFAITRYL